MGFLLRKIGVSHKRVLVSIPYGLVTFFCQHEIVVEKKKKWRQTLGVQQASSILRAGKGPEHDHTDAYPTRTGLSTSATPTGTDTGTKTVSIRAYDHKAGSRVVHGRREDATFVH